MNLRIEQSGTGYVGYVDDVPVCKSSTVQGVYATFKYLKQLPAHMIADAIRIN